MKFFGSRFEIKVNIATHEELFHILHQRFSNRIGFALATLNLDHLTKLPGNSEFLDAYKEHDLIVADGRPIVWLSKVAGEPIELMPGSDLIHGMCKLAAATKTPVAFIGSSDDALAGAKAALEREIPGLNIALCYAPPYGFDPTGEAANAFSDMLNECGAGLCFIALGAPKQEIFAAHARVKSPKVGFASIGAGLDFLAGHQIRAPLLMRQMALEWLWRTAQDPRRMVPRYAKCFAILPQQFWHAVRQR
ncbi:glycosyltransferase [Sulfitobacter sp. SK012]|uniref:WecB/TagA/CpsF family glycosyltransferase n=1 Tax=Sulfitobacter sp. SK012 TaxID=1389005 RepID=UPI000E0ACCB7|nr:WecB/TagA/CpsF family glycosyltransferase [Sulfitobacter sp. SK012]AXI45921.1 glycosyltransferase [Sulfitobacter sp. SK012]